VKVTKGTLLAAGAALIAVAAGGGAIAATKLTGPKAEQQAIINDAASQLGVSPQKLTDALQQALKNRVDQAVKDGKLTKDQADALKKRIDAGDTPLFLAPPLGHRFGGRGFGGPGFGGPGFAHPHPAGLEAAATYLGMTQAQLREALGNGKTLAQIAKDKNKAVDGLVDAMTTEAAKRIDAAATAGKITKDQAADMKAHLKDAVTDVVNGEHRFEHRAFRGGQGFFRGHRGPAFFPPERRPATA
jgi:polyhydroxyalkanoate synthesis regulator phasin